jgi:hypothetical protein
MDSSSEDQQSRGGGAAAEDRSSPLAISDDEEIHEAVQLPRDVSLRVFDTPSVHAALLELRDAAQAFQEFAERTRAAHEALQAGLAAADDSGAMDTAQDGVALAAPLAAAAPPRTASSSLSAARDPPLTFTYHDRFLGKAVRIPLAQHLQIAAPLMLVAPALHFARGRAKAGAPASHQPALTVVCMTDELWPAQRTRFMFGLTVKACDRASTAPASLAAHVYSRMASLWKTCILLRVMSGCVSKLQVRRLLRAGARRSLFCFLLPMLQHLYAQRRERLSMLTRSAAVLFVSTSSQTSRTVA